MQGEHGNEAIPNKKEKSLKMKRDVGMACQKVHKRDDLKVKVNIQSFIHTYFHNTVKM